MHVSFMKPRPELGGDDPDLKSLERNKIRFSLSIFYCKEMKEKEVHKLLTKSS